MGNEGGHTHVLKSWAGLCALCWSSASHSSNLDPHWVYYTWGGRGERRWGGREEGKGRVLVVGVHRQAVSGCDHLGRKWQLLDFLHTGQSCTQRKVAPSLWCLHPSDVTWRRLSRSPGWGFGVLGKAVPMSTRHIHAGFHSLKTTVAQDLTGSLRL